MKTLIAILIIISLLQSTLLPLDLILIILICRSYIRVEKANLYLGFGFGLFNSHLDQTTLGFKSLIYLILIVLTQSLSKSRLAGNPLLIVPLSFILITIYQLSSSIFIQQSIKLFPQNLIAAVLSLPILYLVRLWEERFIIKKEIKLKF